MTGKVRVSKLREIDISDLLGRKEVVLDQTSLKSNIEGKTVLVTGAGGSIGSELCRQIARFNPDVFSKLWKTIVQIESIMRQLISMSP